MEWIAEIYSRFCAGGAARGLELPPFEQFWSAGYVEVPEPDSPFVLFDDFRRDPNAHPLKTPTGRIELYSDTIEKFEYSDCPPHPAWLPPMEWLGDAKASRYPLHLVTTQPPNRLHSQMDPSSHSRRSKVAGRERVSLNPADAAPRGIKTGDIVRLYNDRGACLAGAEVTDDVSPGVALMATGSWFDPADAGLERHGNPNVLTVDIGTSRLSQGCSALTALVDVERWTDEAPQVSVFEPPALRSVVA